MIIVVEHLICLELLLVPVSFSAFVPPPYAACLLIFFSGLQLVLTAPPPKNKENYLIHYEDKHYEYFILQLKTYKLLKEAKTWLTASHL